MNAAGSFDLALQTDAYHLTRSQLLHNPMEQESYLLYARRGGPQVVPDLAVLIQEILASKPTLQGVEQAAAFWLSQGIPFPSRAFREFARMDHLPLDVRGVRDGEVVLPGDPIAVVSGPAALVAVLEAILEARLMTSMQVGANFIKALYAVGGDAGRIFEVGLRAATSPADHLAKMRVLKRLGLRYTSSGEAALALGMRPVGTMGHNYTQRFRGPQADREAFDQAVTRLLRFRSEQGIEGVLPLSFLLDTRSTLGKGLPAALAVMRERGEEMAGRLALSVRLDSGDMEAQFREVVRGYAAIDACSPALRPKIIVESGLVAEDLARFEGLARELDFPRERVLYGLGGYFIGGLSRDLIGLVYKITEFGGDRGDTGARVATMKIGDEPEGGKSSYPGDFELWERPEGGPRLLALTRERPELTARGLRNLFIPIVVDGQIQAGALRSDQEVAHYALSRWGEVTGGWLADTGEFRLNGVVVKRPIFSRRMQELAERLRGELLADGGGVEV